MYMYIYTFTYTYIYIYIFFLSFDRCEVRGGDGSSCGRFSCCWCRVFVCATCFSPESYKLKTPRLIVGGGLS